MPSKPPPLLTTIGPYAVDGLLGQGGMATVYRAIDPTLQRPVALKLLSPSASAMPGYADRFRQEARILAQLRHPNIVQVYDLGEHEGAPYMVQELLPGPTLAQCLRDLAAQERRLPADEVIAIIGQIAAALDAAHALGIIHRDVKPANAIWNAAGSLVLTDFGIAKQTLGDAMQTQAGLVIGTPAYLSPEQAQGRTLDAANQDVLVRRLARAALEDAGEVVRAEVKERGELGEAEWLCEHRLDVLGQPLQLRRSEYAPRRFKRQRALQRVLPQQVNGQHGGQGVNIELLADPALGQFVEERAPEHGQLRVVGAEDTDELARHCAGLCHVAQARRVEVEMQRIMPWRCRATPLPRRPLPGGDERQRTWAQLSLELLLADLRHHLDRRAALVDDQQVAAERRHLQGLCSVTPLNHLDAGPRPLLARPQGRARHHGR